MSKATMIGCDLHDRTMLVKICVDAGKPLTKAFGRWNVSGLIHWAKEFAQRHGSSRIVLAYEASAQGFGLYDVLSEAGFECYVLAPTHLPKTIHRRKNKTDEKDAQMILEELRAHVLAGKELPAVWVPEPETRDDREAVRLRLEVAQQRTRIKNQIRTLLKRNKLVLPEWFTKSGDWSRRSVQWLRDLANGFVRGCRYQVDMDRLDDGLDRLAPMELGLGARTSLGTLVETYQLLSQQIKALDKSIAQLANTERYAKAYRRLQRIPGVGCLTAMVFLTELGDLARFSNRRQLGAYLGLTPSSHESGEQDDRKGHITRQGPARIRQVLCQAAWAAIRCSDRWKSTYNRIKGDSGRRGKIALVAVMRRLAIQMWHAARSDQQDEFFDAIDRWETSAQAQQKGPPFPLTIATA